MPVILSLIPEKKEALKPLKLSIWLLLLFLMLLTGVVIATFVFPAKNDDHNLWFWCQAIILPAVAWLLIFVLRFHIYERNVIYAKSWNQHHEHRRDELIKFAQRPLVLLSSAMISGAGTYGHAQAISNNLIKIASTKPINGQVPIPHSAIARDDSFGSQIALLTYIFVSLKNNLKLPDIEILKGHPLNVKLLHDSGLNDAEVQKVWNTCWSKSLPPDVTIELVKKDRGVMVLDEWLDELKNDYGYLLVVSVQLYEQAQMNSAEAATAMLFAGMKVEGLAEQGIIEVHRPVEGETESALDDAVLWGKQKSSAVSAIWCSEGELPYITDMLIAFNAIAGKLPDVHRVNSALGYAGAVAGWLTLAIAIERCQLSGLPQLVSYSSNSRVFMMVNPSNNA
ncbi:hypothetical protein [Budvicia diplopodorum]|uniref:hypothetical protein n=1 Tax=Budvicia diplopodorum TaxID=1119056 RepID=UPI00135A1157|nr:hypothetical protein [Budvicia diplopodorum]